MSCACLAGWQPPGQLSCLAKALDITRKPFYTFTDLDLGLGSQGQHKVGPLGLIFLYTFQLIRMEFDMVLKQFKLIIQV